MPSLAEDAWINGQAATLNISELEDCAIAVDATYYLQLMLDSPPFHEPLLSALGGLTGLETHIQNDLDQWAAHKITPFFIFDGQTVHGQDDVTLKRGKAANDKTDYAWSLYFKGQAPEAVVAFGANSGAFRVQDLYPMLQRILHSKQLHFLVPPLNASGQMAYFELIDSDQCAGIMGPQELLLYPIRDGIIRSIDWETKNLTVIFKKALIRSLNVSEATFVDALLMTGTSFLSPYPPLKDPQYVRRQPFTINDAVNMLRTAEKSVGQSCSAFSDVLAAQDPTWQDRYRRARMAVMHFVYIAESGEVKVHDFDTLTHDNLQYLGLQLPAELYHYLNTGLIGGRLLAGITHLQIVIPPTLDGTKSEEYKNLVKTQLVPVREQTLALLTPRLHRWTSRQKIHLKLWFDDKVHDLNHVSLQPNPIEMAATWSVKEAAFDKTPTNQPPGSIAFELLSLLFSDFVGETFTKDKRPKGIDSSKEIISVVIWRFLHLRGYLDDSHNLTAWGNALAVSIMNVVEWAGDLKGRNAYDVFEALLLAFELIHFGALGSTAGSGESNGVANAADADDASNSLIGRCASLLKLRHQANGYTGPLIKSLLYFRTLTTAAREADRDLIEAILASMFLHGQSKRERDDYLEISQNLPFLESPDIALGIAVKTFLADISPSDSAEAREEKLDIFPAKFVPNAINFAEDLDESLQFFNAVYVGVQALGSEISTATRATWDAANEYRRARQV